MSPAVKLEEESVGRVGHVCKSLPMEMFPAVIPGGIAASRDP